MRSRDIIANGDKNLVGLISRLLPSDERARFAIGHVFLPGFERYMQLSE